VRIRIVAVGKAKNRDLRSLLADYYARIGRYAKLEEVEIKDGDASPAAFPTVRGSLRSKWTGEL